MDIQKIIARWLSGAESDMAAAEILFKAKQYSQCLFWGHLVIEKLLKALIVRKIKQQAPYSHDLVLLISKTGIMLPQEKRDQLNEITTFNQFGRYDNEIVSFVQKCTPEYTDKYFTIIKQLYSWLMEFFHNKN